MEKRVRNQSVTKSCSASRRWQEGNPFGLAYSIILYRSSIPVASLIALVLVSPFSPQSLGRRPPTVPMRSFPLGSSSALSILFPKNYSWSLFGELPTGEHTLFPISRDQLHLGAGPASTRLNTSTVLHLSDIHFGLEYGFPMVAGPGETPLLEIIEQDLRDAPPGLIIVSGDITSRADANVLQEEGLTFLRALSGKLRVPPECFVVVPGNHDIPLKKFRPIDYSHETSFRLFAKEFYGREVSYPELRSFTLPTGLKVEVLAINSVRLRHEKEKNCGYVEWRLYDRVLSSIPTILKFSELRSSTTILSPRRWRNGPKPH